MKTVFIAFFVCGVCGAHAQTIFSTLGAGDSYISNIGRAISGSQNDVTHSHGEWGWQFTAQESGDLREIRVGAHHLAGANQAMVRIYENGPGDTMGALLATYQTGNFPLFNDPARITVIGANGEVTFVAGQTYWIGMAPSALDTYAAWMDSDQGLFGRMSVSLDGTNYQYVNAMPYSAFSLSTVPEPGTVVVIGAAGLAIVRRRFRRV